MRPPQDPLALLAWHGAYVRPSQEATNYFGRYAWQDVMSKEDLQPLLQDGLAALHHDSTNDVIMPTRAGLEEAVKRTRSDPQDPSDSIHAVLGLPNWETVPEHGKPLAGLYFSANSAAALLDALAAALHLTPRPASVHIRTTGGVLAAAIATELTTTRLPGAPQYQFATIPPNLQDITNLARRYVITLDLRPRTGITAAFMTTGLRAGLLAPMTLKALLVAATHENELLTQHATTLGLPEAIPEIDEQTPMGLLL